MKLRLLIAIGIIYAQLNLYAQSWNHVGTEDFSSGGVSGLVMAIDNSDIIYVAFKDATLTQKVTVMKYDGLVWSIVGTAGFSTGAASEISLAINSIGEPHVAYRDEANSDKLGVKKFNGTAWVNVGNPAISPMGISSPCIAFDNSDIPYVVYRDWMPSSYASVIKFDGANWVQVGTASFSGETSQYTRLAFDNTNSPYIAYGNATGVLNVWKFNGTAWAQLGSSIPSSGFLTPDLTTYGTTPYLIYTDGTNSNKATVKKYNGTNWVSVGSGAISSGGSNYCSIVIDDNGIIYAVYRDVDQSNYTTVMKYNGIDWNLVGTAGDNFYTNYLSTTKTIAVDSNNDVYIATEPYRANVHIFTCAIDDAVTQAGITLSATQSGATYQWLDCNTFAPVSGANGQSFTPTSDGDYACRIAYGSCIDTSDCFSIQGVGINEFERNIISVYPNPTNSNLTIETTELIEQIIIYNTSGTLVQTETENTFSVQNLPAGIYFLQIQTANGTVASRFIKK